MSRKLVVFDFDGTVADTHDTLKESLAIFSKSRNLPYDHKKMFSGYVDHHNNDLGWGLPRAEQAVVFAEWANYIRNEAMNDPNLIPPLFPDAKKMLLELMDKYDLAIITARDRRTLGIILEHHNLMPIFVGMRTLCCVQERGYEIKPAPDALYCLLKDTGHKLEDIVMIGDTTADIDMANAANVKSIAVAWGLHPRERLAASNPTIIVDKVRDLPDIISKLFN